MQNTFSQSGNDSKWFLKKSFFKIGKWQTRPSRDPPPFMANAILNFHFDYLTTSLSCQHKTFLLQIWQYIGLWRISQNQNISVLVDFDVYFVSPVDMSKNIYSGIWVLLSPRVFESLYFLFPNLQARGFH